MQTPFTTYETVARKIADIRQREEKRPTISDAGQLAKTHALSTLDALARELAAGLGTQDRAEFLDMCGVE